VEQVASELVTCDLLDQDALSSEIERISPSLIFHLAAMSAPGKSFARPVQFYDVNVNGTLNLLETARRAGEDMRLVIFSSSDIYGYVQPEELPLQESAELRPANPYAASKVAAHLLMEQYVRNFDINAVEARPFNMIGPGQSLGFVLPDFASQVAEIIRGNRSPVIKVGRLTDKRDFLDVRDAVRAMTDIGEFGKRGSAYNICSGTPRRLSTIIEVLISSTVQKITVEEDPERMRPTRMPIHFGSHAAVTALQGWQPTIPFEKTVADTLEYWLSA
jgi:GDP-4-dehydro-6-deoxy-D-mannose reductase